MHEVFLISLSLISITSQADENTNEIPAGDMETESFVADIAAPNVKKNNTDFSECLPHLDIICK